MNFSSFVKSAAFILSVSIASLAVSYTIFAWLNPSQDPPAVNTTTPINVGGTNQSKSGDLSIGSGLKIWLSKLGDSFALKNDSGTTLLVIGQQDGNTGIGTTSPDAKLEVAGQVKITGGAPAADKLLVSDATGLGSWKTATEIGIGGTLPAGTSGQTLRHNGAAWIGDGNLYNDGTNVGIGTATPSAKLDLNGQIRIRGGAPALGKVLVSDNAGLATWQNPATGIVPSDCGTGTAVLGIDASGQLLCGRQVTVATCSGNKFAKGVDASGNIICGDLPPLCITTSCATLGYTCGAWPNGCGGASVVESAVSVRNVPWEPARFRVFPKRAPILVILAAILRTVAEEPLTVAPAVPKFAYPVPAKTRTVKETLPTARRKYS